LHYPFTIIAAEQMTNLLTRSVTLNTFGGYIDPATYCEGWGRRSEHLMVNGMRQVFQRNVRI
jgi:hypothetical protein